MPSLQAADRMTVDDLDWYLLRRMGLVTQSRDRLRPKLGRWLKRLRAYGFEAMPRYPFDGWTPYRVALFGNLMIQMLEEDVRPSSQLAHQMRNLIGLPGRRYKV
jgi:hypothetical protein